jgi:hypothetical protein
MHNECCGLDGRFGTYVVYSSTWTRSAVIMVATTKWRKSSIVEPKPDEDCAL